MSLPERNLYLSFNAEIFYTSLLIWNRKFLSVILPSVVIISFYNLSKIFFLKCKELSYARVPSIAKKWHGFAVHFLYRK